MKKKHLFLLSVLGMLALSNCSADKDTISENPRVDNGGKPTTPIEDEFTLFPKDHVPDSDVYGLGEILQNQNSNPKYKLSTRKFQGIPSIGKDRFGNLYVGWVASSGCAAECDDNYLTISVSTDKGITWNHDKLVLSVNPEDSTRMKDPQFFNDKFGNTYLFWGKHVKKKNIPTKEWVVTYYSKISLSDDGKKVNYSTPRRIVEGNMLNKLFYSRVSDELIFPNSRWFEGNSELHQPFIFKASYGSKSLVNFRRVGAIPVRASISQIHEHMIVQLRDSTYLGMVRTKDAIYYSKSKDGYTWEDSKKFTALGPTTESRFHLGRLNSGRLILIFNNATKRANMIVCLSDDDGITWPHRLVLDARDGLSYPDMIETEPGILNIVYDYIRDSFGDIIFIKIREQDIINKNQSGFNITKISSLK
nr:sialidase family protein [uncultured Flavobacterium sp.]